MLIVQNDTGNRHSPTVIAAAITSQMGKAKLPTHIGLSAQSSGLPKDSIVLLEQIRTLDKKRLREKMGRADSAVMEQVDAAIAVSFGLSGRRMIERLCAGGYIIPLRRAGDEMRQEPPRVGAAAPAGVCAGDGRWN